MLKAVPVLGILCLVVVGARAAETEAPPRGAEAEGLPLEAERSVAFETRTGTWLSLDVSPDGSTLVFDLLGDLYTLPIGGGVATRLTSGMAFDGQPRFAPDGARVVFLSDRDGAEGVWTVALDGSEPKRIAEGGKQVEFASPAFAPDGSHVVVSRTSWGLRTFELWAYHVSGGKGVRLTTAKPTPETGPNDRHNALGAVYSADGRYLYYAVKRGGFAYNLAFPQWQIARRDLESGDEDVLTQAQGSAFRPGLSPDGRWLVYATRHAQHTGLRKRDLATGADDWLAYPIEHDEQESRFTRDLLPGYAFTPDSAAVVLAIDGGIRRVALADGAVTEIPFTAKVEQDLGPRLHFPYRLGLGPVKARLLLGGALSPGGDKLAFTAFNRVHVHDLKNGQTRAVSPEGVGAFHPSWSPDGRELAYVSWTSRGGHVFRIDANGRGRPAQVTRTAGYYTDPVWTPDGKRLVALRASSYERLYREADFGAPVGSDLVWFPAKGGEATLVIPSRGLTAPHFGPEPDRVYLYLGGGPFGGNGASGLVSLRFDGTDRRTHLVVKGPGIYFAEETVPASDVRLSPDGRHALILHANQLYLASLLNPHLSNVEVTLDAPSVPLARLTHVGADRFGWGAAGDEIYWTVGDRLYRRPLASVSFETPPAEDQDAKVAAEAAADDVAAEEIAEEHEAVVSHVVDVYLPRHRPEGVLALTGGTLLPMEAGGDRIEDGVVVVENERIVAVGARSAVAVPEGATVIDVSGRYLVPGFVDTHAHYRPLRGVLDTENWAFLANLAYGVTTGLDVQPSTTDIIAYDDLIEAGLMIGPRALSTGPGIFSNNEFHSLAHANAVLRRYKNHYGVRNLKAYLAGDRKQRQWVVQAAREQRLMPTTEGGLDMRMDLTHVIDGFSGNEHNFPLVNLYDDVVRLVAESGIAYTPTLLVTYGGPWAENRFYTQESPHHDAKLRRFMPGNVIDGRTLRRPWFLDEEYTHPAIAAQAAKIVRAGGRVGVGAHGQLQGLGYHWELRALASGGFTPMELLTAATRHGAEMIGVAEDLGTLTAGKLADLLVLTADPSQDIANSERIEYVIKNGEMYRAETLERIWPDQRALPEPWWWSTDPARRE